MVGGVLLARASGCGPGLARDALWIGAVSQAMVALVPVLVLVVGTLALIAVGVLAAVVLVLLLTGRR